MPTLSWYYLSLVTTYLFFSPSSNCDPHNPDSSCCMDVSKYTLFLGSRFDFFCTDNWDPVRFTLLYTNKEESSQFLDFSKVVEGFPGAASIKHLTKIVP